MHVGGQTRKASFIEASVNVVVGYLLVWVVQIAFGIDVPKSTNVMIAALSAVSLVRSYGLRRWFNHRRDRRRHTWEVD